MPNWTASMTESILDRLIQLSGLKCLYAHRMFLWLIFGVATRTTYFHVSLFQRWPLQPSLFKCIFQVYYSKLHPYVKIITFLKLWMHNVDMYKQKQNYLRNSLFFTHFHMCILLPGMRKQIRWMHRMWCGIRNMKQFIFKIFIYLQAISAIIHRVTWGKYLDK